MEKKYKFIRILGKPKKIILLIPEQLKKEWEKAKNISIKFYYENSMEVFPKVKAFKPLIKLETHNIERRIA